MPPPLSQEIKQLLDRPNFAHLATLMPDGSPQSVPVWVGREGDRILICTGGDLAIMDPVSRKYTGKPFPFRNPEGRGALVIEVEKARYAKLPFEHTPPQSG
jgi:hypothetical protein